MVLLARFHSYQYINSFDQSLEEEKTVYRKTYIQKMVRFLNFYVLEAQDHRGLQPHFGNYQLARLHQEIS